MTWHGNLLRFPGNNPVQAEGEPASPSLTIYYQCMVILDVYRHGSDFRWENQIVAVPTIQVSSTPTSPKLTSSNSSNDHNVAIYTYFLPFIPSQPHVYNNGVSVACGCQSTRMFISSSESESDPRTCGGPSPRGVIYGLGYYLHHRRLSLSHVMISFLPR